MPNPSLERTPTVRALEWLVHGVGMERIIELSLGRRSARGRWAAPVPHRKGATMAKTAPWLILGLATLLISLTIMLGLVSVLPGLAAWFMWLILTLFFLAGPETVSEITFWKASIKRDVLAARQIREEIAGTAERLRSVVRLIVENSYILGSSSFLAMGADRLAGDRLNKNIDLLSEFAEPDKTAEDAWWQELKDLFPDRKPSSTQPPPSEESPSAAFYEVAGVKGHKS
jgi:hypothetical protein